MELTQEQLKTGIKNQMQEFLYGVYLHRPENPYVAGDIRDHAPIRTPSMSPDGAKYVMRPETENLFVADSASFEIGLKEMFFSSKTIDQIRATRDKDIMLEMPMSSENEFILTSLNKKVALLKNVSDFLERNNSEVLNKVKDSVDSAIVEFNQAIDNISNSMKNSVVTMKDIVSDEPLNTRGMITLGNSLEGKTLKFNNSTFSDSFGDM